MLYDNGLSFRSRTKTERTAELGAVEQDRMIWVCSPKKSEGLLNVYELLLQFIYFFSLLRLYLEFLSLAALTPLRLF